MQNDEEIKDDWSVNAGNAFIQLSWIIAVYPRRRPLLI